MQLRCCLFARKQRLLFESPALFEGVNIIRMGVNIVRMHNLSKMPGFTSSSDNKWKKAFDDNWTDIFVEQVKLYNPDVIIFGGTFDQARSYVMDNQVNGEIVWSDDRQLCLTKYRHKDRLILAAAHPGIRHNVGFWVNSIIDALNEFSKTI